MKRFALLLACLFGLMASSVRAEEEISFDFFYNALEPMGEWAEVDGYGYVWHPADVDADWAPYTDGYWSFTDAGWTWVSYEDWGGITYHYGRWVMIEDYGWCWVPDYEWGPAWVSWRESEDYVGWAPLPPEATFTVDTGIGSWVDTTYDIGPSYYSFCHVRDFGAPVLRHVIVHRRDNFRICFDTRNITRISYNSDFGCVFNGGFDYDYISRRCERPVPALRLVFNQTNIFIRGDRHKIFLNAPRGNALVVGHPRRAEKDYRNFSRRELIKKTFDKSHVSRGWNRKDKDLDNDRARLLVKMREETKGLTPKNSPVRPVRQAVVAKVLPEKVDYKARPVALQKVPDRQRPGNGAVDPNGPRRDGDNDRDGRGNRPDVVNKRPGTNDNLPNTGKPGVRPGVDRDGDGKTDGPGRGPGRAVVGPDNTPDGANRPGAKPANPNTPNAERPDRERPEIRPGRTDGPRVVDGPGNDAEPGKNIPERGKAGRNPRNTDPETNPENDPRERNRLIKEREATAADARRRAAEEAEAARKNPELAPARDAARDAAARKQQMEENAARKNAENAADAQREAARRQADAARDQANDAAKARAAEMQRQQAEAARERAAETDKGRAADMQRQQAEAARQRAAEEQKNRIGEMQRQQAEAARQRAAEAQKERAADVQRQQAESARERAAEANKERAAAAQRQQQEAARERAAETNRERAAAAQRQQQEAARERAEANRQQQAEANRERAAQAQRVQQEAARERAEQQRQQQQEAARERAQQQQEAARERAAAAQREQAERQRASEAAKKNDDDNNNKRRGR